MNRARTPIPLLLLLLVIPIGEGCKRPSRGKSPDSSAKKSSDAIEQTRPTTVATRKKLPPCQKENSLHVIYIADESGFVLCQKDKWADIDIRGDQGEKGDKGEAGTTGADGKNAVDAIETWRNIWSAHIKSVAFIQTKYKTGACEITTSGTGFIVGQNLLATNGHVIRAAIEMPEPSPDAVTSPSPDCPAVGEDIPLHSTALWYPNELDGDTRYLVENGDSYATKADRTIATTDDLILIEATTGERPAFKLSDRNESEDRFNPPGVHISEQLLVIGFSLGYTYAPFTFGIVNAIQPVNTQLLNELVAPERLVYQHDANTGGGSSGGPILDKNGEVVAINFAGTTAKTDVDFGFGLQVKHLIKLLENPRSWEDLPVPSP